MIERLIGPRWIGIHSCSVHSSDGSNSLSEVVVVSSAASAIAGSARKRPVARQSMPLHAFASAPKNVISETASSSVYASA